MRFLFSLASLFLLVLSSGVSFAAQPAGSVRAFSFINDVEPILTKANCNSGGCHAKAGNGQNGFRLSLFGFEPQEDFEHIVKEGRGRRVFPAAPEKSLLLLKATNTTPHGGGRKLEVSSEDYQTLVGWIGQGMPFALPGESTLKALEVRPSRGTLAMRSTQQLSVSALYSDGTRRDVTRLAVYESNDKAMAEAGEAGLVSVSDIPGNVAVMVRYQGLVSTYSASIPLGAPMESLPNANNFIDELVFANLQRLGIPPSEICDDSTFLRRASVDIAGHLPTLEEVNAFLANNAPDKREVLVESLLNSSGYADYFANKWAALLRNKRLEKGTPASFAFHSWLRDGLQANRPYDQWVRELLAATGEAVKNPPVAWFNQVKTPEQQLEDVSQLFLGVRMNCAQCHHHPFERWSQQDTTGFRHSLPRLGGALPPLRGSRLFSTNGVSPWGKTKKPSRPSNLPVWALRLLKSRPTTTPDWFLGNGWARRRIRFLRRRS